MAKKKPDYEVVNEFSVMANQLIEKYPEAFYGIEVDKLRCVKITNKDRTTDSLWQLIPVKMPIRMDCAYAWYVVVNSQDWDKMDEKHHLLLVAEILCGIPKEEDSEGKVNTFDTKGFRTMFKTLNTIDYLIEDDVPHLIDEDVEWVK